MKILSSIKKRCKNCIIIRRYRVIRVLCSNLKHKQRQG